jgi:phosphate transport system permease protein
VKGVSHISFETVFGEPPSPGSEEGGLLHAIVGQFVLVILASLLGIPVGILAGTYAVEYGRGYFTLFLRELCDVMTSVPSIVIGAFVYAVAVKPFGHFSGISGAISLAILMIPVVFKTTEGILSLVPSELREAGYALGATKFNVIKDIVFRYSVNGIVMGVILAVARIGGETAPLLFTSFNNNFFSLNIFGPIASLTVTMYDYAMSPYRYWQNLAWVGAILLTFSVLSANILVKFLAKRKARG